MKADDPRLADGVEIIGRGPEGLKLRLCDGTEELLEPRYRPIRPVRFKSSLEVRRRPRY